MPKIRVFEAFAGIGAQHKSIKKINKKNYNTKFQVVGISDWYVSANIAYSVIHHNLTVDTVNEILKKYNMDSLEDKIRYWKSNDFSIDSKRISKKIPKNIEVLNYLVAANLLSNNYSNIKEFSGETLSKLKIDLLTYSFPCQGLSVANMGRSLGIMDQNSTSHLVWEIDRILDEAKEKPKYLLLENVKMLVTKYKNEYQKWIQKLEEHGYKTFTGVFNANNHNSLQKRERVFALSVLKDLKTPFDNDIEFAYYVRNIKNNTTKNNLERQYKEILDVTNEKYPDEALEALIPDTPSRYKMITDNKCLSDLVLAKKNSYRINTLTTKQDRNPNVGVIYFKNNVKNKLQHRFITPREAFKIMGFEDKDFNLIKPFIEQNIINHNQLYLMAGNSIDVNVLEDIFETIVKIEELNNEK